MKQHILFLTILFSVICLSCNSQTQKAMFYDENNNNTTKEIKSYDNKLFILGQHFFEDGDIQRTSTILCIDTALNKIWDRHLGNYSTKERFEHFTIDNTGNIFITGYVEESKSTLLLKLNTKGEIIWRKEFKDLTSFNNVESYNDSSLIIAGAKRFSDTEIEQDSLYVQKLNYNGEIIWSTALCFKHIDAFLGLAKDKIIVCSNAGRYDPYSYFPASKLICLNQDGTIDWTYDLNLTNTNIDKGVNALNMKILDNETIYVLCMSLNPYIGNMTLFNFSLAGEKRETILVDVSTLENIADNKDSLFLFTRKSLFRYDREKRKDVEEQMIIRKDSKNTPYFTLTDAENSLVDFIELNNTIYMIGNNGDLANNYSRWVVLKENK